MIGDEELYRDFTDFIQSGDVLFYHCQESNKLKQLGRLITRKCRVERIMKMKIPPPVEQTPQKIGNVSITIPSPTANLRIPVTEDHFIFYLNKMNKTILEQIEKKDEVYMYLVRRNKKIVHLKMEYSHIDENPFLKSVDMICNEYAYNAKGFTDAKLDKTRLARGFEYVLAIWWFISRFFTGIIYIITKAIPAQ